MSKLNNPNIFKIMSLISNKDILDYQIADELVEDIIGQIDPEKILRYNYVLSKRLIKIIINALKTFDSQMNLEDIENVLDIITKSSSIKRLTTQMKAHITLNAMEYLNHPTARKVI